jgi:hypothetical protein
MISCALNGITNSGNAITLGSGDGSTARRLRKRTGNPKMLKLALFLPKNSETTNRVGTATNVSENEEIRCS